MKNHIISQSSAEIPLFNSIYVDKIAHDLVEKSAQVKNTDSVMILFDAGGRQLAKKLAELCSLKGCRVWYRVREMEMEEILLKNLSVKNLKRHLSFLNNEIYQADIVYLIRAIQNPNVLSNVVEERMMIYGEIQKPVYMDYRVENTNWQLIYWPTKWEADFEGMTLEEYSKMFFDSCNQDWDAIKKANQEIIEILNKGKLLEINVDKENPDENKRTSLKMSIEGMTFKNSTIDNNYPGAEIFSSPVKESVQGQLYAPGIRMLGHESKLVEDIFFKIKEGKIIKVNAKRGKEDIEKMLNRDEGASYFGEIAFGTNPGLRKNVFNGLLNEKVGGSFHITPGNAIHNETDDKGNKALTDNGNRSQIHWDITILMLPEYGGGEVIVDNRIIQKDGKFTVPGTEILNQGLR